MNERQTYRQEYVRYGMVFVVLFIALICILVWNINAGSVHVSVRELWNIVFFCEGDETLVEIVWLIRMPRIVMAAVLGGALSLSGLLLQTFFHNPIAGPFALGISSGAKFAVALTMIVLLQKMGTVSSYVLIVAAFVGSMVSICFVLLLARRIRSMSVLLVAGIMIGYICSAATDFMVTFAEDSDIVRLHGWSLGSFSGMTWDNVSVAFKIVAVVMIAVFLMSKPIGAYQLGESYAQSLGVNVRVFRVMLILCSSVLSACVTAFAGPVSFVGIAVPHIVKRGLGTTKPLAVIPATILGGAVFCTFCDLIARTAFSPTELNISTVTSILGAPVVITMLWKRSRSV